MLIVVIWLVTPHCLDLLGDEGDTLLRKVVHRPEDHSSLRYGESYKVVFRTSNIVACLSPWLARKVNVFLSHTMKTHTGRGGETPHMLYSRI
jgi:hypothetical protein